jgi:hypothetical protein
MAAPEQYQPTPDEYPECGCGQVAKGSVIKKVDSRFVGKFLFYCARPTAEACGFWEIYGDNDGIDYMGCAPCNCFCKKPMRVFTAKHGANVGKKFHRCANKRCTGFMWEHLRRPV